MLTFTYFSQNYASIIRQGLLRKLKVEIAITVDAMTPFVESTYFFEGVGGPLAVVAYREIGKLPAAIQCAHYIPKCIYRYIEQRLHASTKKSKQFILAM